MKAVGLFICLVGSAFAIPTHPVNHKLRTDGWKTPEKTEDIHPEASKEKNTGYVDKGDLLPRHRNSRPEVTVPGTEHSDEPQTITKHGRTGGEHHVKNSLKSINFLALHNKLGLASDNQDSDSGSSGREQSSSEHYQLSHEKHGNMANQHLMGNAGHPVGALGLDHEQNMWKYNKNTVGLSEKNSESNEEESMEEEEEEWGEETDNREMKHKGHQRKQGDRYKRQQNKNSMQSDEVLRDSSQSIQITKRHGDKFDLEEELRENSQKKSHKAEIPLSQKTHNEDQDENQQSQEMKDDIQVNYQSDHDTVIKIDNTEESNDDDGHDRGDTDHEEYLSKTWKEAAYEEEERIQSNDRESTSTEHEGEGTTEDDAAAHGETKDYQNVKIKDLIHSEQDDYDHEPPNSDSKQLKMSSSVQSINSMESEDKVKTAGSSYGEVESVNNRSEKSLLDPCWNFHCKRGKVCHVDKLGKHHCICQDPAACPSTKDYEHVCGTDNKTYDGACQLFGTKCQLEGTKMGRQLHLDYMGSCKYIPPCTDYEVDQFPLRMRDWLKNILMQYYERDLNTSGILTEKQRSKDLRKLSSYKMEGLVMDNQPVKRQNKREQPGSLVEFHKLKGLVSYSFPQGTWKKKVKKIYQNEKRLGAGDHTAELLLHDFEKNYHMYVYPVHWQFHQLDQHPVDRLLIHSELAPLRASLVPMEHCITRFFQECDGDHDKLIALKEWCHCFGIKEEDINENLLF